MLDELDDGARTGVWVALGVVAFLLFGLIGGLAVRQIAGPKAPAAAPMAAAAGPAGASGTLEGFIDAPLPGGEIGTLYFESGASVLAADAEATLSAVQTAAEGAPGKRLMISGFHDASGGLALNQELAKQRAFAVRDALAARGLAAERLVLRKPESTTGGAENDPQARRVEIHLID